MKKIIFLLVTISCLLSHEVYKEIKINNINPLLINRLMHLNIDLDHVHMELDNSIKFAISESDLGLNPATSGETIRVILPDLTEETRREFIKKS